MVSTFPYDLIPVLLYNIPFKVLVATSTGCDLKRTLIILFVSTFVRRKAFVILITLTQKTGLKNISINTQI